MNSGSAHVVLWLAPITNDFQVFSSEFTKHLTICQTTCMNVCHSETLVDSKFSKSNFCLVESYIITFDCIDW